MIGLLFLAGIAFWLSATFMLCRHIPRWVGVTKHTTKASALLFPLILVAPVSDELIGRWQFHRLCEREAVVNLSPEWLNVKAARNTHPPFTSVTGYAIPIRVQAVEFVDADTGKAFLSLKAFHTNGGFLLGRMGLGLGQLTSCWPKDWVQVTNQVNIDQLLKQGKTK